jgi:hypothetical protein
MASKYLELTTAGAISEVEATVTSAGAGDTGKIVALDAAGKLDVTTMPTGVAPEARTVVASETIGTASRIIPTKSSSVTTPPPGK